jgi:hypothetical protein
MPIICPVCGQEAVLLIAGRCVGCPGSERQPMVYTIDNDPKKYTAEEILAVLNNPGGKKYCHSCGEIWVQRPNGDMRCWHCRIDNSE